MEETHACAGESIDEKDAVATEFESARNRIAELESELESSAENVQLNQQMRERKAARIAAIHRTIV